MHNYATVIGVYNKTMLKIARYFKNQLLYHASTINVAMHETASSEPCDHASTVAMSSEIP